MPISRKINISLVYIGDHAIRNIIPTLVDSPYYNIVGLYFRTQNKKILKEFKDYKIYKEYLDAINDEDVECIYISSPNNSHFKISLEALKKNKHVICEKPLTTNFSNILRLIKQSLRSKKYIFESFMFEHHHQFIKLKELLSRKDVGKILTLSSRFGYPHLNKKNIRYQKKLSGGAFFDNACYLIRCTYLLLGDNFSNINGKIKYTKKHQVDLGGSCLINYKSDVSAFLDWGIGRAYSNEIDIWTEKYRIKVDRSFSKTKYLQTQITLTDTKGDVISLKIKKMNHFSIMFDNFYKIIQTKEYSKYINSLKSYQKFFFLIHKSLFKKNEK